MAGEIRRMGSRLRVDLGLYRGYCANSDYDCFAVVYLVIIADFLQNNISFSYNSENKYTHQSIK